MNISNLGEGCYARFKRDRVIQAIKDIEGMSNLQLCQLSKEQARIATERAQARLKRYYEHLQELLGNIRHNKSDGVALRSLEKRDDALQALNKLAVEDNSLIAATYKKLTSVSETKCIPGIALFLHTGNRSFALLPKMEGTSAKKDDNNVYMSRMWRQTLHIEAQSKNNLINLETRLRRACRLWQRERWSVLPASTLSAPKHTDTAEPFDKPDAGFFNNIMLHRQAVDGWVDAFWGVQSGIRLPIPIPDSEGSNLVILLTSYIPDAFTEWNESSNTDAFTEGSESSDIYVKPIPGELGNEAVALLEKVFEKELKGLSLATNLLKDVTDTEITLLESGMKMLGHYLHEQPDGKAERLTWEKRIIQLTQKLRQVSDECYQDFRELENPMNAAFNQLEIASNRLPCNEVSEQWTTDLKSFKEMGNEESNPLLPAANCTVGILTKTIQSLQERRQATVTLLPEVEGDLEYQIDRERIHPYLLTAILENLLAKGDVHLTLTIKDEDNEKFLQIIAFYHNWILNPMCEQDFLLKPLDPDPTLNSKRKRNGFYLTAQVLWRNNGLIEYYPLCENVESRAALFNLTFSIGYK